MGFAKPLGIAGAVFVLAAPVLFLTSCESSTARQKPLVDPPIVVNPSPELPKLPPPKDYPVQTLMTPPTFDAAKVVIDQAENYYQQGDDDYKQGHLDQAKRWFDRAVDTLLRSPVPLQSDERLQREFDSLINRINSYEMVALKEGDGFTTQKYEPAPSDETLSVETFPPKIDEKLRATAEQEVTEVPHDLPIVINDRVLNFIDYFTHGRGRSAMENGLRRSGLYRPMITRIFKKYGVPTDLIALAQVESGFQPLALSNKKAKGIWQFVPFRGAQYGLKQNWWVDERQDPEEATQAAAQHLRDLYGEFDNWLLAMAAYNCGPGAVEKAIQRTGYADFWQLVDRNVLPLQTVNYVPAILAVDIIRKDPTKYGFDVDPLPALQTERVRVSTPTDLRLIAETIDTPLETLQSLNPQLLRMTTPPNEPDFQLNLPEGTKEKYLTEIASIPADKRVLWRQHRVTEGETLGVIARKYRTTVRAIELANNLTPGRVLEAGTKIIIPASPATRRTVIVKHRVVRGESLASIAAKYDVSVAEIRKWNRLSVRRNIVRGQRLTIRVTEERPAYSEMASMRGRSRAARLEAERGSTTKTRSVIHSVRRGETLYSIAANYNTTVEAIRQLNRISNVHQIHPGEKIRIQVGQ